MLTVTFPREELAKYRDLNACVLSFSLIVPIRHEGRICPFVVFPVEITPELELKQTGEGILCDDEAEATEIRNEIQKNKMVAKTPPVVLASWNGGFTIATVTKERKWRRKFQFVTFKTAKLVSEKLCGFSLRIYEGYLDEPLKLVSEDFLPTIDKQTAEELARLKTAKVRQEAEDQIKIQNAPQVEQTLIQSQLKVLAKSYPETVAFFTNPKHGNAQEAYAAYQRETFALTGQLEGTLNKTEFVKTAKALKNAARRKNPALDAVEFQLVSGWRLRGYDRMTPQQRYDNLKSLGLAPASPEAVRKICERLKLPAVRKPGAPKKSPSDK